MIIQTYNCRNEAPISAIPGRVHYGFVETADGEGEMMVETSWLNPGISVSSGLQGFLDEAPAAW